MSDVLTIDDDGAVVFATLNRPAKGNALNQPLIDAIDELCRQMEELSEAGDTRAIVITGAGDKAFCAGADVTELDGITPDAAREQMLRGQRVFDRLERLPYVVIAAINGFALGGGLELAMSADIRVASAQARVGQPEITLGNVPGWGGTQRLPRLVGRGIATELILTGDLIGTDRAHALGLVNHVVENPLSFAVALGERIAKANRVAVSGAKTSIREGLERGIEQGFLVEADAVADCCSTEEQRAAVRAFLSRKEAPQ